ncbi:MAG: ABC transporter substrate-binding protein [Candidatus Shapirobacteria bacterium]
MGCILGALIFTFRAQILNFVNSPKFQTKIIGIQGLYTVDNIPEGIISKISYGLTINSNDDKPEISPIVKSLQIENNNLDYIFTLNQNLYWQNGKKLTTNDINYQIEGITVTPMSNNTIKVSVKNSFVPLLTTLTKPLFKKPLIGLGDYKIQSITYQEGYIKALKLTPMDKNKVSLTYRFYSNAKDLNDAYKIGTVDEIQVDSLAPELTKWNNTKITQEIVVDKKYSAIFFNTKKIENKQLRQALAYATPKTNDKNERCISPISPLSWAYNGTVKDYNYNPSRAKELFDKNKIEKISIAVTDRNLLSTAEEIKNAWKSILGVETTITIENQIDLNNFDTILSYGSIPHDPDQYVFWHSTQINTNITKFNNSRIDKLLEDGRQAFDQQERKTIYQDFQKFLLEESPVIFLSYPTTFTISRIK